MDRSVKCFFTLQTHDGGVKRIFFELSIFFMYSFNTFSSWFEPATLQRLHVEPKAISSRMNLIHFSDRFHPLPGDQIFGLTNGRIYLIAEAP